MDDKLMEVTCRNVSICDEWLATTILANLIVDAELFYLKHGNLSSFLNHLRHGLHLLPLLGGVLVVFSVPQVSPEVPTPIGVDSIGLYLGEQDDDVVGLGQGEEANLSYVAVSYPLSSLGAAVEVDMKVARD